MKMSWMAAALALASLGPLQAQTTLFEFQTTAATHAQGAYAFFPVSIHPDTLDTQARLLLPLPQGGVAEIDYLRHVVHANGDVTWVGTIHTRAGLQSAVITSGANATYAYLPTPDGLPLRLVQRDGRSHLVHTSAQELRRMHGTVDAFFDDDQIAPPKPAGRVPDTQAPPPAATAHSPAVIDVMVVHSSGFREVPRRSRRDIDFATLTRINHLIELTNQGYLDSGIHARLRLVHTMEVDYDDTIGNSAALADITGTSGRPPSLAAIGPQRDHNAADLVVLLRPYRHPQQGSCGVAWRPGSPGNPITVGHAPWGFSVVSDGFDGSSGTHWYCLETTFSHEIGHNLGSHHDRANAGAGNAVFAFSYGLLQAPAPGEGLGFATVMAYPTHQTLPLNFFSNPAIEECLGHPCGVAGSEDNVRSINLTAPIVAGYRSAPDTPPPVRRIPR